MKLFETYFINVAEYNEYVEIRSERDNIHIIPVSVMRNGTGIVVYYFVLDVSDANDAIVVKNQ